MIMRLAVILMVFIIIIIKLAFLIYLKATVIDGKRIRKQLMEYNDISLPVVNDFTIKNPYSGSGCFYKAQLHTHSTNSDGKLTPEELFIEYQKRGFTFLAITDHDYITDTKKAIKNLNDRLILIKGEEMTWPEPVRPFGGHLNRLFVDKKVRAKELQTVIDKTAESGGIIVINHPAFLGSLGTQQWMPEKLVQLKNYVLLEVLNHHTDTGINLKYWHALLKHFGPEKPVWGMAGDDCHTPDEIAYNYIYVQMLEPDRDALRNALLKGNFYLSQGPRVDFGVEGELIYVRILSEKPPYLISFINGDFKIVKKELVDYPDNRRSCFCPSGDEGFIRIEIEEKTTARKAWSQPFWLIDNKGV
ncbi:MAG TPA: CehA/McbA family metallohydrolase [Halanaerobiales bacterium]|nr:CehA/McbA family metallohydrolase [Halanaerobiales bacterium]